MNNDFVDFNSFRAHSYAPSPVKKSSTILKLQERFNNDAAGVQSSKRSFKINLDDDPFYEHPSKAVVVQKPKEVSVVKEEKKVEKPVEKEEEEEEEEEQPVPTRKTLPPPPQSSKKDKKKSKKGALVKDVAPQTKHTSIVYKGVVHKVWDFGKKKTFRIENNAKTSAAAVHIQRLARGGMQRLHYRILYMQHMIDTRQERTEAQVSQIQDEFGQKKLKFLAEMDKADAKMARRVDLGAKTVEESKKIIAYLRKENKKLREKNEKIYMDIHAMKEQNKRLEHANESTKQSLAVLEQNFKQIEETNKKLVEVEPKYRESVESLKEAVEERRQICIMERKIKLFYAKLLGDVVEKMESSCRQSSLTEEVVNVALQMEGQEHDVPLPPLVE